MTRPLFRVNFPGLQVKIIERKGNPCTERNFQDHYFAGYKLAIFLVGREHLSIPPGHFWTKLVYVRPSWNADIKDASRGKRKDSFITIERDEVIREVTHQVGRSNGIEGDIITFTFYSTIDRFERSSAVIIPHNARLQIPIERS